MKYNCINSSQTFMNCKVEDNVLRGFPRQDWASGLCQRGSEQRRKYRLLILYKINCELLVTVWELWSPWDPLVFDFFQSCALAPRQRASAQDVPARERRYIGVFCPTLTVKGI